MDFDVVIVKILVSEKDNYDLMFLFSWKLLDL